MQSLISEFDDIQLLGNGALGRTYSARDKINRQRVAIKELCFTTDQQLRVAKEELSISKKLKQDRIVSCLGSFESDGRFYIIFEFIDGGSLEGLLQQSKEQNEPITEKQLWDIATGIALSLHYLHSKKIFHKNLKFSNVFLTESGTVKLADFWIERLILQNKDYSKDAVKQKPTEQSDIWALGSLLYELAEQQQPFSGKTSLNLTMNIMSRLPKPFQKLQSPELQQLILGMLEKNPSQRLTTRDILRKPEAQERINQLQQQSIAQISTHSNVPLLSLTMPIQTQRYSSLEGPIYSQRTSHRTNLGESLRGMTTRRSASFKPSVTDRKLYTTIEQESETRSSSSSSFFAPFFQEQRIREEPVRQEGQITLLSQLASAEFEISQASSGGAAEFGVALKEITKPITFNSNSSSDLQRIENLELQMIQILSKYKPLNITSERVNIFKREIQTIVDEISLGIHKNIQRIIFQSQESGLEVSQRPTEDERSVQVAVLLFTFGSKILKQIIPNNKPELQSHAAEIIASSDIPKDILTLLEEIPIDLIEISWSKLLYDLLSSLPSHVTIKKFGERYMRVFSLQMHSQEKDVKDRALDCMYIIAKSFTLAYGYETSSWLRQNLERGYSLNTLILIGLKGNVNEDIHRRSSLILAHLFQKEPLPQNLKGEGVNHTEIIAGDFVKYTLTPLSSGDDSEISAYSLELLALLARLGSQPTKTLIQDLVKSTKIHELIVRDLIPLKSGAHLIAYILSLTTKSTYLKNIAEGIGFIAKEDVCLQIQVGIFYDMARIFRIQNDYLQSIKQNSANSNSYDNLEQANLKAQSPPSDMQITIGGLSIITSKLIDVWEDKAILGAFKSLAGYSEDEKQISFFEEFTTLITHNLPHHQITTIHLNVIEKILHFIEEDAKFPSQQKVSLFDTHLPEGLANLTGHFDSRIALVASQCLQLLIKIGLTTPHSSNDLNIIPSISDPYPFKQELISKDAETLPDNICSNVLNKLIIQAKILDENAISSLSSLAQSQDNIEPIFQAGIANIVQALIDTDDSEILYRSLQLISILILKAGTNRIQELKTQLPRDKLYQLSLPSYKNAKIGTQAIAATILDLVKDKKAIGKIDSLKKKIEEATLGKEDEEQIKEEIEKLTIVLKEQKKQVEYAKQREDERRRKVQQAKGSGTLRQKSLDSSSIDNWAPLEQLESVEEICNIVVKEIEAGKISPKEVRKTKFVDDLQEFVRCLPPQSVTETFTETLRIITSCLAAKEFSKALMIKVVNVLSQILPWQTKRARESTITAIANVINASVENVSENDSNPLRVQLEQNGSVQSIFTNGVQCEGNVNVQALSSCCVGWIYKAAPLPEQYRLETASALQKAFQHPQRSIKNSAIQSLQSLSKNKQNHFAILQNNFANTISTQILTDKDVNVAPLQRILITLAKEGAYEVQWIVKTAVSEKVIKERLVKGSIEDALSATFLQLLQCRTQTATNLAEIISNYENRRYYPQSKENRHEAAKEILKIMVKELSILRTEFMSQKVDDYGHAILNGICAVTICITQDNDEIVEDMMQTDMLKNMVEVMYTVRSFNFIPLYAFCLDAIADGAQAESTHTVQMIMIIKELQHLIHFENPLIAEAASSALCNLIIADRKMVPLKLPHPCREIWAQMGTTDQLLADSKKAK
ncbi:MAG: putative Serine/threonine-protein kinase Nek5, partial [Streblomastix strix]